MRCPICRKEVQLDDPEQPFCSKRCRTVDLGNWAMERYRIPGPPAEPGPKRPEGEDDEEE